MGNIMVRMGVVIGVMLAVQLGFLYVGHLASPTPIEPPQPIDGKDQDGNDIYLKGKDGKDVHAGFPERIPTEFGTWAGKDASLDERSFNESEANVAVSRIYNKEGRDVKFLLAEYRSPRTGLYHNPMNCYRAQGFTQVGPKEWRPLKAANRPDINVSVTTWVRNSEKVIVAYWYEIGDYTLYERQDLLPTQWAMFGKTKWPVMFKVLLEMPADDAEQGKADLLDVAQFAREWLGHNQPVVD